MLAATFLASSLVMRFAAARRPGCVGAETLLNLIRVRFKAEVCSKVRNELIKAQTQKT
jgi:hypothetical protein